MTSESWTVPLIGGEAHVEVGPEGLVYESRFQRDDGEPQEAIRRLSSSEVERLATLLGIESTEVVKEIKSKWPDLLGLYGYLIDHGLGTGFVW